MESHPMAILRRIKKMSLLAERDFIGISLSCSAFISIFFNIPFLLDDPFKIPEDFTVIYFNGSSPNFLGLPLGLSNHHPGM